MKEYVNAQTCRRKILLGLFTPDLFMVLDGQHLHKSFDLCSLNCVCLCKCECSETRACEIKCIQADSEIYNQMISSSNFMRLKKQTVTRVIFL